jgi:hypothetical protein
MINWDEQYRHWLEASYLYYIKAVGTQFSDYEYDYLANQLLNNWECVTHPHKHLVDEDSLRAGTAFDIKEAGYPEDIRKKYV